MLSAMTNYITLSDLLSIRDNGSNEYNYSFLPFLNSTFECDQRRRVAIGKTNQNIGLKVKERWATRRCFVESDDFLFRFIDIRSGSASPPPSPARRTSCKRHAAAIPPARVDGNDRKRS